jgi:hypothetical protein
MNAASDSDALIRTSAFNGPDSLLGQREMIWDQDDADGDRSLADDGAPGPNELIMQDSRRCLTPGQANRAVAEGLRSIEGTVLCNR